MKENLDPHKTRLQRETMRLFNASFMGTVCPADGLISSTA
jgi:hypothetical protein